MPSAAAHITILGGASVPRSDFAAAQDRAAREANREAREAESCRGVVAHNRANREAAAAGWVSEYAPGPVDVAGAINRRNAAIEARGAEIERVGRELRREGFGGHAPETVELIERHRGPGFVRREAEARVRRRRVEALLRDGASRRRQQPSVLLDSRPAPRRNRTARGREAQITDCLRSIQPSRNPRVTARDVCAAGRRLQELCPDEESARRLLPAGTLQLLVEARETLYYAEHHPGMPAKLLQDERRARRFDAQRRDVPAMPADTAKATWKAFRGRAAVYGVADLGGEILEPGCFRDSLEAEGHEIPMLTGHNGRLVDGRARVNDTPEALLLDGRILTSTDSGRNTHARIVAGVLDGLSIGFAINWRGASPPIDFNDRDGTSRVLRAYLFETSFTPIPRQRKARLTYIEQ